jgi:hypothetical protein
MKTNKPQVTNVKNFFENLSKTVGKFLNRLVEIFQPEKKRVKDFQSYLAKTNELWERKPEKAKDKKSHKAE